MARQIIDLSIAIENEIISDPVPFNPKVDYFDHAMTADGFEIICLPVKIKGASAGWTRAVAVIDG